MRATILALAAVMLCGPASADELTGTLKKVKDGGRIVLGVRDAAPPFSYLDDAGKPIGYSIDICNRIVEAVRDELHAQSLRVETSFVTSSTRIPLMTNGAIDLECGTTTNNVERQKQVVFTNAHFVATSKYVAKKAASLKTIDDLRNKPVVSVSGSVNIVQLNKVNSERKLNIRVLTAKDVVEAFLLVESDRAAAFVMDDVQLSILIAQSKSPASYAISDDAFAQPEPYGIMLRKDDAPFKAVVDRATAALYRSPDMVAIYAKWFQSPVPPRGVDCAFPMPAALKRAFAHPTDSADPAAYGP